MEYTDIYTPRDLRQNPYTDREDRFCYVTLPGTGSNTAQTAASAANQQLTANLNARSLILRSSVFMRQQIYSNAVTPANTNILNIPVTPVGLITGFLIKVQGTIHNGDATATINRTQLGASNLLSQIVFTDLTNTVRVQTTGWHMGLLNSAKQPLVFGGAYAPNVPVNYGNNWTVQSAPASVAAGADAAVQFYYYLPLAYAPNDLTGSMFAQVVNAQASIQVTINPTPVTAVGQDATLAVYSGSATAGWKAGTTVTVTVWQFYYDQLPRIAAGQPLDPQYGPYIMPKIDLSNIYELKNVAMGGIVQGQDFGIPYANFRTFLSTAVIFDNAGTLNVGSDINYWALRASNTTSIFQYGPNEPALFARSIFLADPPNGVYWFDNRNSPIQTQNFGNIQLFLNASQVNTNSGLLIGFENFANISQVQFASSLPTAA
jgi:P3 major capsid protein